MRREVRIARQKQSIFNDLERNRKQNRIPLLLTALCETGGQGLSGQDGREVKPDRLFPSEEV
jgi:hypothetical protein